MSPIILAVLVIVILAAAVGPFLWHELEKNLEAFLFVLGIVAVTASGRWSEHLLHEAFLEPVKITLAVLIAGFLFSKVRDRIQGIVQELVKILGPAVFSFLIVFLLGVASSVITAIIASLVLAEVISGLKLDKPSEVRLTILTCFSIGLGAALTPIGEPLSTIAISKLKGEPYHADFWFLARLLGVWILLGILFLSGLAAYWEGQARRTPKSTLVEDRPERIADILLRAGKVYLFVMALIFLGSGFAPVVDAYLVNVPGAVLYWVNTVSAILDNATLTAAEISPNMHKDQIEFLLMGLLIAGGMLIPGNIPNIISAAKLNISSRDWAKTAVPLGFGLMLAYFLILEVFR